MAHQITHVVFDMDGTLLDTEELYTQSYQKVLDEYGHTYTFDFKTTLMGQAPLDIGAKVCASQLHE